MHDSKATNAGEHQRHISQDLYDALLAARTADKVTARFRDGRTVDGALIFNPFKGTGRIINIDQEVSIDFKVDDLVSLDFGRGPVAVSDERATTSNPSTPRQQLESIGVIVCIPQAHIPPDHTEWVLESLESLVKACGLEVVKAHPPVLGSFMQWFTCRLRDAASATGTPAVLDKARRAFTAALLDKPTAEATGALAKPAAELLAAVSRLDTCVIRVGQLVILKEHAGKRRGVTVATISPQLAKQLDSDPTMGMSAPELLAFLRTAAQPTDQTTRESSRGPQRATPTEPLASQASTHGGDSAST